MKRRIAFATALALGLNGVILPSFAAGCSSGNLVTLNVTATASDGNPVLNLKRNEFSITENGKPQAIAVFVFQGPELDLAPVSPGSSVFRLLNHRLITFLFDFTAMTGAERTRVQDDAIDFIHHDLKPGELLSIETAEWDSIETTLDFTNDHTALVAAVNKFRNTGNTVNPDDQFVSSMFAPNLVVPGVPDAHGALATIATACGHPPIAMKKSLLYFSAAGAKADDRAALNAAANACTKSGVTMYPVASAMGGVTELALRTGGQAFPDRAAAVDEARRKTQDYYVLGYYSSDTKQDGKYRTVELKLTRLGMQPVTLDYQHGYFGELPEPPQFPPVVCF